jgi:hypothetical protein
VINLVDLAGSEKVGKTGATGDRLKEGNEQLTSSTSFSKNMLFINLSWWY